MSYLCRLGLFQNVWTSCLLSRLIDSFWSPAAENTLPHFKTNQLEYVNCEHTILTHWMETKIRMENKTWDNLCPMTWKYMHQYICVWYAETLCAWGGGGKRTTQNQTWTWKHLFKIRPQTTLLHETGYRDKKQPIISLFTQCSCLTFDTGVRV